MSVKSKDIVIQPFAKKDDQEMRIDDSSPMRINDSSPMRIDDSSPSGLRLENCITTDETNMGRLKQSKKSFLGVAGKMGTSYHSVKIRQPITP